MNSNGLAGLIDLAKFRNVKAASAEPARSHCVLSFLQKLKASVYQQAGSNDLFTLSLFEQRQIEQILRPPRCALVDDEVLAREHSHRDLADGDDDAACPGLFELHARDAGQDVDTGGREPDLE